MVFNIQMDIEMDINVNMYVCIYTYTEHGALKDGYNLATTSSLDCNVHKRKKKYRVHMCLSVHHCVPITAGTQ